MVIGVPAVLGSPRAVVHVASCEKKHPEVPVLVDLIALVAHHRHGIVAVWQVSTEVGDWKVLSYCPVCILPGTSRLPSWVNSFVVNRPSKRPQTRELCIIIYRYVLWAISYPFFIKESRIWSKSSLFKAVSPN